MIRCAILLILCSIFIARQVEGQDVSLSFMSLEDELVTESTVIVLSSRVSHDEIMTHTMQTHTASSPSFSMVVSSSIEPPLPTIPTMEQPSPTPVTGKVYIRREILKKKLIDVSSL